MSGNPVLVRHVWESDALALDMITAVRAWCKAREDQIKQKILNGEKTDAALYFKVVNGRSSRTWKDPAKMAEEYPAVLYPEFWHEPEFKSVAQVQEANKQLKEILWDEDFTRKHVEVTPGAPTIARIEDPRTAIDKISQAKNEFMLEDQRADKEIEKDGDSLLDDLLG